MKILKVHVNPRIAYRRVRADRGNCVVYSGLYQFFMHMMNLNNKRPKLRVLVNIAIIGGQNCSYGGLRFEVEL